ncbi:MAG: D-inositol 3-phosphate glycosyltransferase [Candidatus Parcubacteria bacterium]|jgi:glycosyltransferase involved in cell wall biosynthesis
MSTSIYARHDKIEGVKTRILMFGWEFPPYNSGGLGVACLGLTRSLSKLGAEVVFVMPKKLDVRTPWAKVVFADIEGIEARVIDSPLRAYATNKRYLLDRDLSKIYGSDLLSEVLRYAAAGAAIAREEAFDVIYAHDWLSFGAGVEAKRASGKPLIVHVHATEFDRCGGPLGVNRDVYEIEKRGMEAADVVIAVSEMTKSIITREYGIPAWKVRVVYNGIDEATVPREGSGLPRLRALRASGYSLVLFLGRVTLQKGPDYFLRAAKKVAERNPKVLFVLSGDGDMQEHVMRLAAELGLGGNVFFTGFLNGSDRHEVYASADLFVMPSVSEPFGITALEAMKLRTPVLISKQSGVCEVVKHALKADFWDVDEMANMILSVVGYPGLREALAENAAEEAERLTWEQAAKKVSGIVHELVS